MFRGINIGNALDSPVDEDWGVEVDFQTFDLIASAGFDTVRLPVRFTDYLDSNNIIEEEFLNELDSYINYALEKGLVIIIDLHHFNEIMINASDENLEIFYSIWEQLSQRYKDYPKELIFELLNEPTGEVTVELWNEMVSKSVEIIREYNKSRKIIISTPKYAIYETLDDLILPEDENLIVTFHYYSPMEFTFQNNENHDYVTGEVITWDATDDNLAKMEEVFYKAYLYSLENNVDILLGEFGTVKEVPEEYRYAWTKSVVELCEKYNIAYTYWELLSDFGIYDSQLKVWNEDLLNVLIGK